jgi:16S rRNA (guanine1207-N2)-methyltransferase
MPQIYGTKNKQETLGLFAKAYNDLVEGSSLTLIQPNAKGGKSIEKLIKQYFPYAHTESRNHARYITVTKTSDDKPIITEWLKYTDLRLVEETGFYAMPGLFGWNKIDGGSFLLLDNLESMSGVGADFGCGYGYLSKNILSKGDTLMRVSPLEKLYCFDSDERAVEACRKNVTDDRAIIQQADCTKPIPNLPTLDFILMNPPFHDEDGQDISLGVDFIQNASQHLKKGGILWMVANRHLPYETSLMQNFSHYDTVIQERGFKVIRAIK